MLKSLVEIMLKAPDFLPALRGLAEIAVAERNREVSDSSPGRWAMYHAAASASSSIASAERRTALNGWRVGSESGLAPWSRELQGCPQWLRAPAAQVPGPKGSGLAIQHAQGHPPFPATRHGPDHRRVPDPGTLRHHPPVDAVLVGRARNPLAKMRQAHAGARDGVRYPRPPPDGPAAGDARGYVGLQDLTPWVRVAVHDVIGLLQTGETVDSLIARCSPALTRAQVYESLAYYEDHRGEIDVLVARQMSPADS